MDSEFEENMNKLADHIVGTPKSPIIACEEIEIPEYDDLEDKLLDKGIELCGHCGWWNYSYMLTFIEDSGNSYCDECLKDLDIEA
jgi:hypothetical protein